VARVDQLDVVVRRRQTQRADSATLESYWRSRRTLAAAGRSSAPASVQRYANNGTAVKMSVANEQSTVLPKSTSVA